MSLHSLGEATVGIVVVGAATGMGLCALPLARGSARRPLPAFAVGAGLAGLLSYGLGWLGLARPLPAWVLMVFGAARGLRAWLPLRWPSRGGAPWSPAALVAGIAGAAAA